MEKNKTKIIVETVFIGYLRHSTTKSEFEIFHIHIFFGWLTVCTDMLDS